MEGGRRRRAGACVKPLLLGLRPVGGALLLPGPGRVVRGALLVVGLRRVVSGGPLPVGPGHLVEAGMPRPQCRRSHRRRCEWPSRPSPLPRPPGLPVAAYPPASPHGARRPGARVRHGQCPLASHPSPARRSAGRLRAAPRARSRYSSQKCDRPPGRYPACPVRGRPAQNRRALVPSRWRSRPSGGVVVRNGRQPRVRGGLFPTLRAIPRPPATAGR
jgi:hypothetical protein